MFDVIVVGARCAGSPTAMLLARNGHRVLMVDKATFPSDKLSTHYIHPPGIQAMERWGVMDSVLATNPPPITKFSVYAGGVPLPIPPMEGVAYCPRRYLLDKILLDAAVAAGVEMREAFTVDEVLMEGDRVTGIAGHGRGGERVTEEARYVVGADSHHSVVAKAVKAPKYREREALTGAYYSYWRGVPTDGAEIYVADAGGVLAFPTNDGQLCIAAGMVIEGFKEYRADIEGTFTRILEGASPEFAARVRSGKREERWMGSADVPNFFRKPWGDGWALVGDAGYMKDPVTGWGMSDAFRDAELLAAVLDEALSGRRPADEALGSYQEQRDAVAGPIYEMTLAMASGEFASQFGAAAG